MLDAQPDAAGIWLRARALWRPPALATLGRSTPPALLSSRQNIWENQHWHFTTLPFSAPAGFSFPSPQQTPVQKQAQLQPTEAPKTQKVKASLLSLLVANISLAELRMDTLLRDISP